MKTLFIQAKSMYKTNPTLSKNYIRIARKIAMAASIRFSELKVQQTCKKCNMLLVPGETSRVRIKQKREPHIVTTCLSCGSKKRILLRKNRKEKQHEHQ
ncbi:MAG: ribonuclease P protein component 4 [Promethearchaeota archaeon]